MAKYDDFGRPIYETAEEYNKARKAGNNSRTYESPEGDAYQHTTIKETYRNQSVAQRHTTRQGSKNAKKMVLGLVVFFIVLNIGIVFSMFKMVDGIYEEDDVDFEEDWIGTEEYIGDAENPLPEGFETFSYNAQTCTLPTSFEDIVQMGLVLEEYDEEVLFPREWEEMVTLYDEDGVDTVLVRVNNHAGDDIPMGKCMVDYFYIYNPALDDETETTPNFEFGDGLTFESSYEDVEAYFGTPYYYYEEETKYGNYYESYDWAYYGEDEIHYVTVTFWNDEMSSVSIEKKAYEEKY